MSKPHTLGPMEALIVTWFNKLKGYGEGAAKDGRTVFLHYSAIPRNGAEVHLEAGQSIFAEVKEENGRFVAFEIALQRKAGVLKKVKETK